MPRTRNATSASDANVANVSSTSSGRSSGDRHVGLVDLNKYSYEQVFYATEFLFNWKFVPNNVANPKGDDRIPLRGLSSSKNKLPLVLCSNASGDFVLKPMLLFTANEINELRRNGDMSKSPVYWKASEKTKGILTVNLFEIWFSQFFVADVEKCLKSKKLPVKAVLIVDESPGHKFIDHSNIEIKIIPSENIIKPVSNVLISQFMECYQTLFSDKLDKFVKNSKSKNPDVKKLAKDFIDKFTLKDGVELVASALKNFQSALIREAWQKVLPEEAKATKTEANSLEGKNKRRKIK